MSKRTGHKGLCYRRARAGTFCLAPTLLLIITKKNLIILHRMLGLRSLINFFSFLDWTSNSNEKLP